jgi:hypothetical protein
LSVEWDSVEFGRAVVLRSSRADGLCLDCVVGRSYAAEVSHAEVEREDIELDQGLQDRKSSVSSLETQVKLLREELAKVKENVEQEWATVNKRVNRREPTTSI